MQTITQLISIQAFAPLFALILVGAITLHAYLKHRKQNKEPLTPNVCNSIRKQIYLLNQEIDETSDTERLQFLTKKILKLEEHLTSLQDYDIRNYSNFDWKVALLLFLISGVSFSLIAGIILLIF